MRIPARLLPHKIIVKPVIGQGRNGPVYGPAQEWDRVYVEDKTQIVKNSSSTEMTSSGFVVTDADRNIPEQSRITVWKGTPRERESTVVSTSFASMPRMPSNITAYLS